MIMYSREYSVFGSLTCSYFWNSTLVWLSKKFEVKWKGKKIKRKSNRKEKNYRKIRIELSPMY